VKEVAEAFRDHDLFTFSSALAFRVLVSLVPLTLLGLALLGVFGLEDVWTNSLGPTIKARVTLPVYRGIDFSVKKIFHEETLGLIAFAALLALWNIARGMRIVMKALNVIHDHKETRGTKRLVVTDVALALAVGLCLIGAFLAVVAVPRLADGFLGVVLYVTGWAAAALLLGVAIGLVVHFAPAERPEVSWASAGSLLVVVSWVVASLAFGWWAGSVANYKSAIGSLLVFLLLTTYVLTSTTIFLVGAQIDELARKGGRR